MSLLFSNLIPIFIIIVIVIVLLNKFKNRKNEDLKRSIHQQKQEQAKAVGIQVANQADGHVSNSGEIHGDTRYNGTTGGIDWTLTSTVLVGDRNVGAGGRNQVWKRKSVWKTQAVKLPAGKFIMLMSTPGEIKLGSIKRGGFINDMINKAADAVLDLYVKGYFGSEYKSLVSIGEDGVKIERDQLKDFMILTNFEPLAHRYFDDATSATISNWKKSNVGFREENKVDQFGLLFSPNGVILTCQTSMNSASEVKAFSDFGTALVIKMQQVRE